MTDYEHELEHLRWLADYAQRAEREAERVKAMLHAEVALQIEYGLPVAAVAEVLGVKVRRTYQIAAEARR